MTDEPELHDLTKFILSRLESYPEEFVAGRWEYEIGVINAVGVGNNRKALNDALENHHMDKVLQYTLKKLLVPELVPEFVTGSVSRRMKLLDGSFTSAVHDNAAQAYVLMRDDGTTYRIPQHRVENDLPFLAAIQKLMLK